jgi:hypothetical protein
MAAKDRNEPIFRRYEREYLDRHHRSLPLSSRTPGEAAYALLAAFETGHPPPQLPVTYEYARTLDHLADALALAFRWFHAVEPGLTVLPTDRPELIREARAFLRHAVDYVILEDLHKSHGRGVLASWHRLAERPGAFLPAAEGCDVDASSSRGLRSVAPFRRASRIASTAALFRVMLPFYHRYPHGQARPPSCWNVAKALATLSARGYSENRDEPRANFTPRWRRKANH